jgi:hypothetical protein
MKRVLPRKRAHSAGMGTTRHVIVVHHAPFIVEVVDMVLSMKGYTVHPASSYVRAKALLNVFGSDVAVKIQSHDITRIPYSCF